VSALLKTSPRPGLRHWFWLSGEGWERVSRRLLELLENQPNLDPESLTELQLYLQFDASTNCRTCSAVLSCSHPGSACWRQAPPELTGTPAWQEFRKSLPAVTACTGQAEAVYSRIKTALNHCKAQLQDGVIPVSVRDGVIPVPEKADVAQAWFNKLEDCLSSARMTVLPLLIGFQDLASQANEAVNAMDFRFLFDERHQVFHIGYNVGTERLDPSYYDLLASEARLASLIAIAKGDAPQSHWQHLGRPVTKVNGKTGIALLERHHVRISHAHPVRQKTTPGHFSRKVATQRWIHRFGTGRIARCPGASPNQATLPSMSI